MDEASVRRGGLDRRRFLAFFAALGLAGTSLPRRLWAAAADGPITRKALTRAEQMAGLEFTYAERELMLDGLTARFLKELERDAVPRKGLILDLRFNFGGNVHDRVLTALTKPVYSSGVFGDYLRRLNRHSE